MGGCVAYTVGFVHGTALTLGTAANTPQTATTHHIPAALRSKLFELKEKKAAAVETEDYGAAKDLKAEIDDLTEQIT